MAAKAPTGKGKKKISDMAAEEDVGSSIIEVAPKGSRSASAGSGKGANAIAGAVEVAVAATEEIEVVSKAKRAKKPADQDTCASPSPARVHFSADAALQDGDSRERMHKRNRAINVAQYETTSVEATPAARPSRKKKAVQGDSD